MRPIVATTQAPCPPVLLPCFQGLPGDLCPVVFTVLVGADPQENPRGVEAAGPVGRRVCEFRPASEDLELSQARHLLVRL